MEPVCIISELFSSILPHGAQSIRPAFPLHPLVFCSSLGLHLSRAEKAEAMQKKDSIFLGQNVMKQGPVFNIPLVEKQSLCSYTCLLSPDLVL